MQNNAPESVTAIRTPKIWCFFFAIRQLNTCSVNVMLLNPLQGQVTICRVALCVLCTLKLLFVLSYCKVVLYPSLSLSVKLFSALMSSQYVKLLVLFFL
jgi:hypothetical protein